MMFDKEPTSLIVPKTSSNKEMDKQIQQTTNSIEAGLNSLSLRLLNLNERNKNNAPTIRRIAPVTRKTNPEFFLSVLIVMLL